ncbi:MAG: mechanosensitive ion channel family protein [Microlunatus sp.]|nr:mechanosensitive ion channel family protein [Microlunatus sp.]MDN5769628.1 mechanosensitive ion channel family protein [Microlunatus sp.]MDN5803314.1 mechanosensitive ion channel family protein [Microlunatus sp.]
MPDWLPDNLAEVVVFTPARIVFIGLVAVLARLVSHRLIDRAVRRSIGRPAKARAALALESASGLPADRRSQRIQALGSLAKSLITVVIMLLTSAMVLAELGFNITTIVAGTSVVAAALAFGTQSIIKDLLSGIFMLVEDQLGVGDFVDMQLASGTVEEIGLRVTQLRADDGTIWYVRNGEVLRLANFSKGGPDRPKPAVQNLAVRMVEPEPLADHQHPDAKAG